MPASRPHAARRSKRSTCPVSCTLDLVGDRWTLLIVRDLMLGKRRYAEFLESSERIPTNLLAERLKRLVADGVVTRERYSTRPLRMEYRLTGKGEDLRPLVRALVEWGLRHVPGTAVNAQTARTERPAALRQDSRS